MNVYRSVILTSALLFAPFLHASEDAAAKLISEAPADAKVYIISPKDGEKVGTTFTVKFGLSGMGVAPAGVDREKTGHHHLLIDVDELPDMTKPLPASENIIHFGGGQTETEVTLPPGKHTLQLVLGNHLHIPHKPLVISKKITVTVE
ncbi:DUF4399 domain-containing protein [Microbulbifer thermotolerans]|uniref:DUF4399 domain-containing protein n=1 Tax=Microbulbifer thermotolerans TaxID=252514 RepID=A0A143HML6_MICTH|nr:DUF4399 domain-containing protein [Microbulbifer thermotolerans]AMX02771.1 rod shape-determining protein RodA [Microbulbifer thermotolerans]MCX2779629.1 DUF4399 domain-containing protein [Microbulbifer thermotolerans]MCX2782595.1 DUF4399 domain-containing protein [Microbulbifer thermotolerans]MCX2794607.1 DUF4399 domain-containing protein [Microbulbifer thermotolerans]MCX2801435.1 DUF4399 domain-containing protein [Microbulbifer thermotolerans]